MKRKGALPYDASPEMIIGTIVIIASVSIAMGFLGSLGSESGESSDRSQLSKLHTQIEQKCVDAGTTNPSTVATSIELKFHNFEELRVEDDSLVAKNPGGDNPSKQLTGCDYVFDGFPASLDTSTKWTFVISHEGGNAPPTIRVEASSS